MPFPYIYTFYSFKGGVGRSMALVNVAYALAGKGRHVLMVDMDLEAPGISGFLERTGELKPKRPEDDILSVLAKGVQLVRHAPPTIETVSKLPPLGSLIRSVLPSKLETLKPKFGSLGRLDILPIRTELNYGGRLANCGLKDLSSEKIATLSDLLHAWFKAYRFQHRPYGLEDFEPSMETPYDYILVDSRTGITEIGGLCVGPLADRLVVLTGLNDQNIHGTRDFLTEVGIQPVPRAQDDKPWDDADPILRPQAPKTALGPKPTILVASPTPAGEVTLKKERFAALQSATGLEPLQLSYQPLMALFETNFVRDYPDEALAGEYLTLTTRLMEQVSDDARTLAFLFQRHIKDESSVMDAVKLALRAAPDHAEVASALLPQVGNAAMKDPFTGKLETRQLFAFLAQDSNWADAALSNWGNALLESARHRGGTEGDSFFAAACRKYEQALAVKPDMHDTLTNWGNALRDWGKAKASAHGNLTDGSSLPLEQWAQERVVEPEKISAARSGENRFPNKDRLEARDQARSLFIEAYSKYEQAHLIRPDSDKALFGWGDTLATQAITLGGSEAEQLLTLALKKYESALAIKPDLYEALNNWGSALFTLANIRMGQDAELLLKSACEKYEAVVSIKPDKSATFSNWGLALHARAVRATGSDATRLFASAYEKYQRALSIQSDDLTALMNWGITLRAEAKTVVGVDKQKLLAAACKKYEELLSLQPNKYEALINCSYALADQSRLTQGATSEQFLNLAIQKIERAVDVNPAGHGALAIWGSLLLAQAKTKTGKAAEKYFEEARDRLLRAERILPGSGSYDLACISSLQGKLTEAMDWLKLAKETGHLPNKTYLIGDSDLDPIRSSLEFEHFLNAMPDTQRSDS